MNEYQMKALDSRTLLKQSEVGVFKSVILMIASQLGKLFFLSYPLFALAEVNLINRMKSGQKIKITDVFDDASDREKYGTMAHIALMYHVIILAVTMIMGGLAFGLISIGISIDGRMRFYDHPVTTILSIVSGVLYLIIMMYVKVYFSSMPYIIHAGDNLSLSDCFKQNDMMLSHGGKLKIFSLYRNYMIKLLVVAFTGGVLSYIAWANLRLYASVSIIIVISFIFLVVYTKTSLSYRIGAFMLCEDLIHERMLVSLGHQDQKPVFNKQLNQQELLLSLFNDVTKIEKDHPSYTKPNRQDESKVEQPSVQYEVK